MDRDLLEAWLEQGRSLTEIGTLTNRDPSTVGYWVKKHGLVANGATKYASRGGMRPEELEPLVAEGRTLKEMADALDRSKECGIIFNTVEDLYEHQKSEEEEKMLRHKGFSDG